MELKPEQMGVVYRKATLGEILPLREKILIAGTDRVSPHFEGDDSPDTLHIGAFSSGRNIACLSLMLIDFEGQPAYQLRGMAVEKDLQRQGFGTSLLQFSERWIVRHTPIRLLWCNARTSAVEYYIRVDWKKVSDEFTIEGVGPHFRMIRDLSSPRKESKSADPRG